MNFKYLQTQSNVSQAGGREFEPRLPLGMKNTENQSLTLIFNVGLIHYLAHIVYVQMVY